MKRIALVLVLYVSILLAGCGTASSTPGGSPTEETLPAASKLILGTFQLEDTRDAVTAGQAAELLPLWEVYSSLSGSDTAAQEEIDALVEQIQGTMTAGQLEAIDSMGLTQADITSLMVQQNLIESVPQQSSGVEASTGGGPQGDMGGMPPSDLGAGDPSMITGSQPASSSSQDTSTTTSPESSAVPSALLDALIQLLQTRAG